ncbi:MAG: prepilin-type N-terminal cleavage/methylation domain-containing protein [Phycisphaerae bacterium]|nr:prepilin-type N-terminal cleavage/methylation domain-containing protein [Phycisphaerae bacterium]
MLSAFHYNTMRQARNAFTLIELLVVIAIISLLVSILLPSLTKAKELAKQTLCLTQLRNLGSLTTLYAEDHHGTVMAAVEDSPPPTVTWYQVFGREGYMDLSDETPYRCPSHQVVYGPGLSSTMQIYGMRATKKIRRWGSYYNIFDSPVSYTQTSGTTVKKGVFGNPADFLMFADSIYLDGYMRQSYIIYDFTWDVTWRGCAVHIRHFETAGGWFADGHVSPVSYDQLVDMRFQDHIYPDPVLPP